MLSAGDEERAFQDGSDASGFERLWDLRRCYGREFIEELVTRASCLSDFERSLIDWVFRDGRTVTDFAVVSGLPARTLRRRVRALARRVRSGRFAFVVTHATAWPALKRRVAKLCFVEGKSQREVAEQLRLSLHAVRRHCASIQALYEASARERRGGGGKTT